MRQEEKEKVKIIFANFFGVSPFRIDESQSIYEQFDADIVDVKELSWILSEAYHITITEDDVVSVNSVCNLLKKNI